MNSVQPVRSQQLTDVLAALSSGSHRAGTLSAEVLGGILDLLPAKEINSVETGCGKSTVAFSNISKRHISFCYDDRELADSSVSYVMNHPNFIESRCSFVFGPTQATLPQYDFNSVPLFDLALIDGPHGFPFPDLEYWHLYPRLAPGALLIIDDLMIPSIGRMYDILREDRMFDEIAVISTTGILRRSGEPPLPNTGDHWWEQAYNFRRFPVTMQPYKREFDYTLGETSRLTDESIAERHCLRGFHFLRNEGVATIDTSAVIRFTCETPAFRHLAIRLRLQIDNPHASEGATVSVNGAHVADFPANVHDVEFAFSCPTTKDQNYYVELKMPAAKPNHDRKANLDFQRDCCTVAWFSACLVGGDFATEVIAIEREAAPHEIAGEAYRKAGLNSRDFLSTLNRLCRLADTEIPPIHVREVAPPPVLSPDEASPVRFLPLTGTKSSENAAGFARIFPDKKRSWTFVDLFAFEGADFAYAVFRSLLLRSPNNKEVQVGKVGNVSEKIFLVLEADYKARRVSGLGRFADFGVTRFLYRLWRRCSRANLALLANPLKRLIEASALRLHTRHARSLAERRLLLEALTTLSGKH